MQLKQNLRRVVKSVTTSLAVLMIAGAARGNVVIATVPVGNIGNPAVVTNYGTFGSVNYAYSIGKYDVTASQYAAFLNAVAATDTYGCYDPFMAAGSQGNVTCDISQSGSNGSYTYATTGNPNLPVNYVTFWDACRFANWLENGQPTGPEGSGTTETGTYTLTPAAMAADTVVRNPNSVWAVSSQNEWVKAAYYNASTQTYYDYATRSNNTPSNTLSATGTNNANLYGTNAPGELTPVGTFAASVGPYGTFDQNGDVFQWVDTTLPGGYIVRGGSFTSEANNDCQPEDYFGQDPTQPSADLGFRISEVPEPTCVGLMAVISIQTLARRRKVTFGRAHAESATRS